MRIYKAFLCVIIVVVSSCYLLCVCYVSHISFTLYTICILVKWDTFIYFSRFVLSFLRRLMLKNSTTEKARDCDVIRRYKGHDFLTYFYDVLMLFCCSLVLFVENIHTVLVILNYICFRLLCLCKPITANHKPKLNCARIILCSVTVEEQCNSIERLIKLQLQVIR